MSSRHVRSTVAAVAAVVVVAVAACSGGSSSGTGASSQGGDGAANAGGHSGTGGQIATGGNTGAGGTGAGGTGTGGTGASASTGGNSGTGGSTTITLPTPDAEFDYQLGGSYSPPAGATMVVRDRTASVATGLYNVCYVNGFQIQPHEESFWLNQHPTLVLRDGSGDPVIDQDWDEMLLDVGTASKRDAIAAIVGDWIADCGNDGFDAVEIDNLDSYARSGGRLSESDAVAFMALLSARAHAEGMAIAQKNAAEILDQRAAMGTDFAVVEECNRYDECQDFVDAYGNHVFVVEYRQQDFNAGCSEFPNLSILLRDLDLVPQGSGGYVHDEC